MPYSQQLATLQIIVITVLNPLIFYHWIRTFISDHLSLHQFTFFYCDSMLCDSTMQCNNVSQWVSLTETDWSDWISGHCLTTFPAASTAASVVDYINIIINDWGCSNWKTSSDSCVTWLPNVGHDGPWSLVVILVWPWLAVAAWLLTEQHWLPAAWLLDSWPD